MSGEVVILAVLVSPSLDAVEQYADQLDGKVIVDISNPVDTETFDGLRFEPRPRVAEEGAEGAKVVKAFNTTFAALVKVRSAVYRSTCSSR